MSIILTFVAVFLISVVTLYLTVRVFGAEKTEFRVVFLAAIIITVVNTVLGFIPVVGWIASLIVNVIVIMNILECSLGAAIGAIIIWSLLTWVALLGLAKYLPSLLG